MDIQLRKPSLPATSPVIRKSKSVLIIGRIVSGLLGAFVAFAILNFTLKNEFQDGLAFEVGDGPELEYRQNYLNIFNTLDFAQTTFQSLLEELTILIISAKYEFNVLVLNEQPKEIAIIGDMPIEGGIGGLDHIISLAEFYRENLAESRIPIIVKPMERAPIVESINSNYKNTPIGAPTLGEITSEFGKRISPFTNQRSFHTGIDISISEGSPVRASADGYVIYSGRKGGYGKIVHLKHENGKETLYAHLSKVNVLPGHKVVRGQTIGKVGSTGQSTGPHLHYEVRHLGRPINPKPFIEMAKLIKKKN